MDHQWRNYFCLLICSLSTGLLGAGNQSVYRVPDEQRLYRELMWGYESSVRPVLKANSSILVQFKLTLNQIIDLDEREQVLTTNVFIDQSWTDESLVWDPADYNGIKTIRIHESQVWLPDTFLFNNADQGSTGFMRGMYVLLNHNGTVLWPVPVKLRSSCKVDITYFPFDDQQCQWRFGSWIYSGSWIDFHSSRDEVDLLNFIDNSEWELISIQFEKSYQYHAPTSDSHPDLLFTLHIRRRTLFYIFNIIAPCVMLSILTLLTFWLPTTSGEKISLGLSVFLAFSMFMLLIAEEVPATSNSVPLIGIYLTTVMTMTSVSVIMAVMVINLYNRGSKAVHAPRWVRVLVLEGLSRMLGLKHDIDKLTDNIKLDKDEEAKYACMAHPPVRSRRSKFRRPSRSPCPSPPGSPVRAATASFCKTPQGDMKVKVTPQGASSASNSNGNHRNNGGHVFPREEPHCSTECSQDCCIITQPLLSKQLHKNGGKKRKNGCVSRINGSYSNPNLNGFSGGKMKSTVIPLITITGSDELETNSELKEPESPIWKKRDSVRKREQEGNNGVEDRSFNYDNDIHSDVTRSINNNDVVNKCIQNRKIKSNSHAHEVTLTPRDKPVEMDMVVKASGGSNQHVTNGFTQKNNNKGGVSYNTNNVISTGASRDVNLCENKNKQESSIKNTTLDLDVSTFSNQNPCLEEPEGRKNKPIPLKVADVLGTDETPCQKKTALLQRRQMVVEWQTIATVIDRLLFWVFLAGTVAAYVVILFIIPYTKPQFDDGDGMIHTLQRAKRHMLSVNAL